jgi:hypothetical protein
MTYWVSSPAIPVERSMLAKRTIWCDSCTSIAWAWRESLTKRYGIRPLVYFEPHLTIAVALQREKNIKHWSREWKIDLIVASNPDRRDLYQDIVR